MQQVTQVMYYNAGYVLSCYGNWKRGGRQPGVVGLNIQNNNERAVAITGF
jgi:hypothetical protein